MGSPTPLVVVDADVCALVAGGPAPRGRNLATATAVHVGSMSETHKTILPADLLPRYTERDVAAMLCVSVRRLQNWRFYGNGGPAYVKIGGSVRYRERDIVEFLERHTVS